MLKQKIEKFIKSLQESGAESKLRLKGDDIQITHFLDIIGQLNSLLRQHPSSSLTLCGDNSLEWIAGYASAKLNERIIFVLPTEIGKNIVEILDDIGETIVVTNVGMVELKSCAKFERLQRLGLFEVFFNSGKVPKLPDKAEILFTSGSTGKPKGVVIEEGALLSTAETLIDKLGMKSCFRELLSMSFGHSFGLARLRACFVVNAKMDIYDGWQSSPKIIKSILLGEIQGLGLVPAALEVVKGIARRSAKEVGSQLKYLEIGSSSISYETRLWLKTNFSNVRIKHHYGMTEASRSFFAARGASDDIDLDCLGIPAPLLEYKIVNIDESGIGELWVKGPNIAHSYFANEPLTRETFSDGGFLTGDMVKIVNNEIYLKGRTDSMINVGGKKVAGIEIEDYLENYLFVESAICFANPDKFYGSRPAALIKLSEGFSEEEAINLIINSDDLTEEKRIIAQNLKFLDNLPLTANGKKRRNKNALVELFLKKI